MPEDNATTPAAIQPSIAQSGPDAGSGGTPGAWRRFLRWRPIQGLQKSRVVAARAVAGVVDLIQIVLFPFFLQGALSPANAVLDVVTGVFMTWLLGWHIAFLPSFISEETPLLNLAPSWTIAVWWATSGKPEPTPPRPDAGP